MEGMSQILPINGMMNQDDEHKYVRSSDGQVIERINLRPNSIDGKRFVNEKIKGNILIDNDKWSTNPIVLPAGTNKVVGYCHDFQSSAIIYFIYNSQSNHSILRYYPNEKTIEKVWFAQSQLDLEDSVIRAFIADGMLYWVNGSKQPKSFIISKAVNYTNQPHANLGDGSRYTFDDVTNLAESILPMIKRPPRFAPDVWYTDQTVEYPSGLPINYNNLRRRQFQFKYKYTYLDNQESAWSPISKVPLPDQEVSIEGEWDVDSITKNNAIRIAFNTGNSYVKRITLAVRECQDRTAVGDFYVWYEVDKFNEWNNKIYNDDVINSDFTFLNTKRLENINTQINNRYFDDVPLSADDTLLLDGKYAIMSMPLKNYDLDPVSYQLYARSVEIETYQDSVVLDTYEAGKSNVYVRFPGASQAYANSTVSISFTDSHNQNWSYTYNVGPIVFDNFPRYVILDLVAKIQVDLANIAHLLVVSITDGDTTLSLDFDSDKTKHPVGEPSTMEGIISLGTNLPQPVWKTLKRYQYHPFAIVYNDGFGRYNVAQGEEELFVDKEPCPPDYERVYPEIQIHSKPPVWAKSYRIAYIPNKSYTYFVHVPFIEILHNTAADKTIQDAESDYNGWAYLGTEIPDNYCFLMINQAIDRMKKLYPGNQVANYIFQEGDRIRPYCYNETWEIAKEHQVTVTSGDNEAEITGYLVRCTPADIESDTLEIDLLEVYRPNVSASGGNSSYNNVYLEIGDEYEVLSPGTDQRRHGLRSDKATDPGDVAQVLDANNNPSSPAILKLDFGDCYIRGRRGVNIAGNGISITVEDLHYTDFFASSGIDTGRAVAKTKSEQKTLNSIVRGENFIEGSLTNWLNVFLPETVHFDASDIYGKITGIEEMGGTLKVIQEHKEGSIMIGQVTAKYADMGDWIFIGDTVFGAYRRYEEDRGCKYRRGMATNNRNLYYFDENTAEFIRSSPNGQAPVSKEYNMQSWFEAKAKQFRQYTGDKDVVISFDNDYEEVIVSFRLGTTSETIVFSEKEGFKGITRLWTVKTNNDTPENFAFFKDTLVAFMAGNLYLHGEGNNNTYFGVLHGCSIKVPVNQYASMTKRYSSVRYSTDKNLWYTEFNIDEGLNYPVQKSILVPAAMRLKENAVYSDILRNIIGRNGVESLSLIHDGTRLVGESMDITLSDNTNEDVSLGAIQCNFLIAK